MSWGRSAEEQKWVDEANAAEEERARCRRELQERYSIEQVRAELQQEIATLRAEMSRQSETMFAAAGQALGDISNRILDRVESMVNRLECDLQRRFGEAMGRIDAIAPDARSRSREYKFANERDDEKGIVDLPNPLTPLVRKVTMN